jgi:hypothetical protein
VLTHTECIVSSTQGSPWCSGRHRDAVLVGQGAKHTLEHESRARLNSSVGAYQGVDIRFWFELDLVTAVSLCGKVAWYSQDRNSSATNQSSSPLALVNRFPFMCLCTASKL